MYSGIDLEGIKGPVFEVFDQTGHDPASVRTSSAESDLLEG